jgi:hypothetical protein
LKPPFSGKASILVELIRRERLLLLAGIDRIVQASGDSLEGDICALIQVAMAHQLAGQQWITVKADPL